MDALVAWPDLLLQLTSIVTADGRLDPPDTISKQATEITRRVSAPGGIRAALSATQPSHQDL